MTTARDLLTVALDTDPGHPPEQGDLSLALAGAELLDLLDARALTLDAELIVPGDRPTTEDRLLESAAASLQRQTPYEPVEEWLWRRGRGLASAYLAAFEEEGRFARQRPRRLPSWTGVATLVDSPARRWAGERWEAREPVLATLACAARIGGTPQDASPVLPEETDEAVVTVLAAVDDAVTELTAVRQRRDIEQAAFDNVWRGPGG
ncbi:GPP34 family phosphoprotein [Streptomyces sp. NPDC048664]|uniref:GPP34 family phosphoprotein n=1 Tax=Streptomyces sp. NPDC048664 TaxID=3154505 RepID=UPI00341B3F8C